MIDLYDQIITVLITVIITSFVTYIFGFRKYLKQREREEIRETYIENGIEKVLKVTEDVTMACYLNYSKVLTALGIIKKSLGDRNVEKKLVRKIFSEMNEVKVAPDYGNLKLLIFGSKDLVLWVIQYWNEYQQLNEFLRHFVLQELETYFNREPINKKEKEKFIKELKKQIREYWNIIVKKHEPLRGKLLVLQVEADRIGISDIKDIDKLENKKNIKKIINEIEKYYKDIKSNVFNKNEL